MPINYNNLTLSIHILEYLNILNIIKTCKLRVKSNDRLYTSNYEIMYYL